MTDQSIESAVAVLDAVVRACSDAGRDDLADALRTRIERVQAPAISVVVAGDYKAGKSSLVNALVGADLCPVDDDVATGVCTMLRRADEPVVLLHEGEGAPARQVPFAELARYVVEQPDGAEPARGVEVGVPSALLDEGLVLVDTPGVGGLGSQYTAATLAALSLAHAVLFVSDATQEYTGPELEFLAAARAACPRVVPVLTKADLFPEWDKIRGLDEDWLRGVGLGERVVVTSAALARLGRELDRDDLSAESGVAELAEALRLLLQDGRRIVATDGLAEARAAIGQLAASVRAELDVADRPADVIAELESVEADTAALVGDSAEWVLLLDDGITELESDLDVLVTERLRLVQAETEAAVREADPADGWDDLEATLARRVGAEMSAVSTRLVDGTTQLAQEIGDRFAASGAGVGGGLDVGALTAPAGALRPGGAGNLQWRRALVEAGWGGVEALGAIGSILTFTSVSLFNPFSLVVGLFIGGRSWRAAKRRGLEQRRDQAVTAIRQYLEDVGEAARRDCRSGLRRARRELRLSYQQRAASMHRSGRAALEAARRAADEGSAAREARRAERTAVLDALDALDRDAVGAALGLEQSA